MVDAIIGMFALAAYALVGLIVVFITFWVMACAYAVTYDVTHQNEWKKRDGRNNDNDEQWL